MTMCAITNPVNYCLTIPELTKEIIISPVTINKMWDKKINTGDKKGARVLRTIFALEVWYKKCYLLYA
jgi:hypothetical protein